MEEIGKKRLTAAIAVAAGIVYFLVCARPLRKEYVLAPKWACDVASAPQAPGAVPAKGAAVFPFKLDGRFGYFDASGAILFAAPLPYGVALAKDAFASYDQLSEGFAVRSPAGAQLSRASIAGYPFFASARRFVLAPDQCSVTELGPKGEALWHHEFGAVITAFSASAPLAVFGLMDGRLVGLGAKGEQLVSFAPGGSRLECVYGVAVSPDGLLVAAVCGLDKQRLVVLEKRSAAYRVTYHRWLDSDFRHSVAMAFTEDGKRLVYETPGGAGVYDRETRKESLISADSVDSLGESVQDLGMLALLIGAGSDKRLLCSSPGNNRLVDLPLRAEDAFLAVEDRSLFLGVEGDLVRLDLREE